MPTKICIGKKYNEIRSMAVDDPGIINNKQKLTTTNSAILAYSDLCAVVIPELFLKLVKRSIDGNRLIKSLMRAPSDL